MNCLNDVTTKDCVTYCKIPTVDGDGKFSAFNTCRDILDEDSEHSCDIIIYTKEEVGEINYITTMFAIFTNLS